MVINDRDLATEHGFEFRKGKRKFSFYFPNRGDDILSIDPDTEKIEITITTNTIGYYNSGFGTVNSYAPAVKKDTTISGVCYYGLTIECKSCCQFSYTIQIFIDLEKCRLIKTCLNSETISLEDNGSVHEIKNIYSFNQTEYTCFAKNGSCKEVTLPLIEFNLSNPKETVSRIKKLIIFS